MPSQSTLRESRRLRRRGARSTTQASPFVGEEMRHKRSGKHPVRSRKQAIAIGLSKARRAGVRVPRRGRRGAAAH